MERFAPAKINLMLHVTGQRTDGYHLLQTLIAFADVGDVLRVEETDRYTLHIDGPFAHHAPADDNNLVTRAVRVMEQATGKTARVAIHLTKNIPAGAGLGGGSSDAACVMLALNEMWNGIISNNDLALLGLRLGAELPVCLARSACVVEGIGEKLTPIALPPLPLVLAWPGKGLGTADVFKAFRNNPQMSPKTDNWLASRNDLTDAAISLMPDVRICLDALAQQSGCALSRMSGSGSTCFGIFETQADAKKAAQNIGAAYPHWWVKDCSLNA